jgi:hypothetical protein
MHEHQPELISAATPPPIETHHFVPTRSSPPSNERISNADQTFVPTQRSAQTPRWVYGALAAIALASGTAGYMLRQPEMRSSGSIQPHQPKSTGPAHASAPPLRQATTGEGSARVVAATYASPDAKAAAAAPAAIGSAPVALPTEAKPKLRDGEASREMGKPMAAPAAPLGATTPAASKVGEEVKGASAPGEADKAAPGAAAPSTSSEKIVLEDEPEATAKEGEATPPPPPGPFDKEAARIALEVAGARAQGCRKATDPSGTARIVVTFAPSGRVTSATVSGEPYAGSETGGCLASAFRGAIVPAYAGSPVTVSKTIVVH